MWAWFAFGFLSWCHALRHRSRRRRPIRKDTPYDHCCYYSFLFSTADQVIVPSARPRRLSDMQQMPNATQPIPNASSFFIFSPTNRSIDFTYDPPHPLQPLFFLCVSVHLYLFPYTIAAVEVIFLILVDPAIIIISLLNW